MGIKKDIFNLLCVHYNGDTKNIGTFETEEAAHARANTIALRNKDDIDNNLKFLVVHYFG